MSMPGSTGAAKPFASELLQPSTLTLDRRNSQLVRLQKLRERCSEAAGALTIDHEVDHVRTQIRSKALDEDFSVAVRERWQTWSRNANPFRSDLASSAATELNRSAAESDSDSDGHSETSALEDAVEQEEDSPSRKRKRRKAFRADEVKAKVGESEVEMTEAWDVIRQEREAQLSELDAALPSAFRFSERQLKVYAHRLKPKYINSLDRPFEAADIPRLVRPSKASQNTAGPSKPARSDKPQPSILTISFFTGSLDFGKEDAAARNKADASGPPMDAEGDSARDEYVKRICGDGLGGMKRTQIVELLSSQTLSDLQSALFCWSDEQPERSGWRKRLGRQLARRDVTSDDVVAGSSHHHGDSEARSGSEEDSEDQPSRDPRFARFTGKRRETDTAIIVEGILYGKGLCHGIAPREADYVTLLEQWKSASGHASDEMGWTEKGGDLSVSFDQLKAIRIGHPYWLLHQGDCVHCFVVEQIRALRPSEQLMLADPAKIKMSAENAPRGSAAIPFPRITWLSTPTMLRFAADSKGDHGLGHRILQWEEHLPFSHDELDVGAGPANQAGPSAWQVALSRTKRKDEGLLRKKQGKCLACSLRKAQVGILGGNRVHLPPTHKSHREDDSDTRGEPIIAGADDHLVTLCTPCAAMLGLPTLPIDAAGQSDAAVQLDWQRIDEDKGPRAGWTVFPMY